jgi:hypothetical protein
MTTMPHINLNGTAPAVLLEDHLTAIATLRSAISTLQAAAPHSRDFQTAPQGTYNKAYQEHRDRLARLEIVMGDLEAIAEHISDHIDRHPRR